MRRIRIIVLSLLGFSTAILSPVLNRCLAFVLCALFSANFTLCNFNLATSSQGDAASAFTSQPVISSNSSLIAQASYCNSGTVLSLGMSPGFDGRTYFIAYDFTRGLEKVNSAACGREYQTQPDPNQPYYGTKFVYLVDGFKNRISSVLYVEIADGSLQVFKANQPQTNSRTTNAASTNTITSLDDSTTEDNIAASRRNSDKTRTRTSTNRSTLDNSDAEQELNTSSNNFSSPTLATASNTPQVNNVVSNIKINFQPDSAPVPSGYSKDTGLAYDDTRGFGWIRQDSLSSTHIPLDISPNTRDRNRSGIDQRLDTVIHMQFPPNSTNTTAVKTPAAWEYTIPNGTYNVIVSVGDQAPYDAQNTINVEGINAISLFQGASTQEYKQATIQVTVSDGKLTIDAIGGTNTKLNYIDISTPPPPNSTVNAKINFQPDNAPIPSGYTKDIGLAYDTGRGFGWIRQDSLSSTHIPLDISPNTRDRNRSGIDQRLDTVIHMQFPLNSTNTTAVKTPAAWEYAVPNGTYNVTVSVGDQSPYDAQHTINIEGVETINFFQGSSTREYRETTVQANVSDGQLTIDATGGNNTKLNYVKISSVANSNFTQIDWDTVAPSPIKRGEVQGALVNGKYYTFGGFDPFKACCTPTRRAYVYDPVVDSWTRIADLPVGVTHAGFTTDGQDIYYAGGYIEDASQTGQIFGTKAVRKYSVSTNTYSSLPSLPVERSGGQLVLLGNDLHYFGGTNLARTQDVGNHYVLSLNGGINWSNAASLPNPRHHLAAVVMNGKIYAIGGQHKHDGQLVPQNSVHVYDSQTDKWTQLTSLPTPRNHMSSSTFVMGDRIIVVGGQINHNSSLADVTAYDPASNTWTELTPLPLPRQSGAGVNINGYLYYTNGSLSTTTFKGIPVQ